MENKKTSVQWYATKQYDLQFELTSGKIDASQYYEKLTNILEKAKAMEEKEIVENFNKGMEYGIKLMKTTTRQV